jgi:hypothetical protein
VGRLGTTRSRRTPQNERTDRGANRPDGPSPCTNCSTSKPIPPEQAHTALGDSRRVMEIGDLIRGSAAVRELEV